MAIFKSRRKREDTNRAWIVVTNETAVNLFGGFSTAVTTLAASGDSSSVLTPLTISLAMCLLGGGFNMMVTQVRYPIGDITKKMVGSVLIALMVFFICSILKLGWDWCGAISGLCGWLGYIRFFNFIEGIANLIIKIKKKKLEDTLL